MSDLSRYQLCRGAVRFVPELVQLHTTPTFQQFIVNHGGVDDDEISRATIGAAKVIGADHRILSRC